MTCLVMQESVIFFECRILDNTTLCPQMSYYWGFSRKWPISMELVIWYTQWRYTLSMIEHFYWRNMFTVTSYNMEFRTYIISWWCLHHITLLPFDDVYWCWNLTSCSIYPYKIACSSNLQWKSPKNASPQNLIVIGHTHRREEAWIWVLVGHPHHSPLIGSSFNPNPMDFLTPCQIHQLSHASNISLPWFITVPFKQFTDSHLPISVSKSPPSNLHPTFNKKIEKKFVTTT